MEKMVVTSIFILFVQLFWDKNPKAFSWPWCWHCRWCWWVKTITLDISLSLLSKLQPILSREITQCIFSSTGHRPASLCHGPLSVVRASIRPYVNFFFKHLLLWNYLSDFDEISQKCSHHDSFKNSGCHGNKTENFLKSLKIFLSETIRPRATKFGM